jgi:2-isopropylmalate synthase
VKVRVYDATLTEGVRGAGVQFAARDRLRVALRLADLGVAWVEGGWPARAADHELFREARRLELSATLVACAGIGPGRAADERELRAALRSGAGAVTLLAPVVRGRVPRLEARLAAAVRAVRRAGREPLVELGDFFDARRDGAPLALRAAEAAARAGAAALILSDTSGGALPPEVEGGVAAVRRATGGKVPVGIRARDDAGVAVANTLAAVGKGALVVAGTVNGYGERCGAADLVPVLADLELKLGCVALAPGALRRLTSLAHFVAELADREPERTQPYAGRDAFAGGTAAAKPHASPEAVGNRAEQAMSDERGRPRALEVARSMGLAARGEAEARKMLGRLAAWERRGFRYEEAEASFELVLRSLAGRRRPYFKILGYRTLDVHRASGKGLTEATVELAVGHEVVHTAASGVGPVNALDGALRKALEGHYPEIKDMRFVSSRSRALPTEVGTAGAVRVVIESADGRGRWGTAGISDNFLHAVMQALADAAEYKLWQDDIGAPSARR